MTPRARVADGFAPDLPIQTDRLVLRSHRVDDLDDLVGFHGDPDVVRFVPWPVRDRAATEQALSVKLGQSQLAEPGQWLALRETEVFGEVRGHASSGAGNGDVTSTNAGLGSNGAAGGVGSHAVGGGQEQPGQPQRPANSR
jgi:hypothetical protein